MRTKKIYICSHVLYSMKKRTFVYLNSGLVERARKENINISGLTEEALRQSLEIEKPRTALEHLRELLADVGNETSMYGDVYFTPFQIQSLTLTKVGPFDNFQADFCSFSTALKNSSMVSSLAGRSSPRKSRLQASFVLNEFSAGLVFLLDQKAEDTFKFLRVLPDYFAFKYRTVWARSICHSASSIMFTFQTDWCPRQLQP